MPWQLLALITATSDAARILIAKKTVKDRSPLAVTFYMNVVVFRMPTSNLSSGNAGSA